MGAHGEDIFFWFNKFERNNNWTKEMQVRSIQLYRDKSLV